MVKKGLIPEAKTKEDLQAAVREFKLMTSKHPERSVEDALARLNEADKDSYRLGSSKNNTNNEEYEEDDEAMEVKDIVEEVDAERAQVTSEN